MYEKPRVVSITAKPTVVDADGAIRADAVDLAGILNNIDDACGRNDCLRRYIFALRDLQHAIDQTAFLGDRGFGAIHSARAAVAQAFDRLIIAEFTLNREMGA